MNIKCDKCFETVRSLDMEIHKTKTCILKMSRCNRCNISFKELHYCPFNLAPCAQGCGYINQLWYMNIHAKECSRSIIECPMKNNCSFKCERRFSKEHRDKCLDLNSEKIFNRFSNIVHEMRVVTLSMENPMFLLGGIRCVESLNFYINCNTWVFFTISWCETSLLKYVTVNLYRSRGDKSIVIPKETTMTATLVNTCDTINNFTQDLDRVPFNEQYSSIFSNDHFIRKINMEKNLHTDTCYIDNNECTFILENYRCLN